MPHDALPPARAGIGLRAPHVGEVLATRPPVGWLEVHAENYMGGGPALRDLERIRRDYPVALHGVGLSLGTAAGIDARHLERLARLAERLEPCFVSEHLSWSVAAGVYLNHLLPLPYTEEALEVVRVNVDRAQARLGRPLLLENPSSYLRFRASTILEPEFLGALAARTGCGLLCDVTNAYVTAHNLGLDPVAWIDDPGFEPFWAAKACDYAMPDILRCGGLEQTRQICQAARAHGVIASSHNFSSGVGLAATLHLMAALPETELLEFDPTGMAIYEELFVEPLRLEAGHVYVPTAPGLGVRLTDETCRRWG